MAIEIFIPAIVLLVLALGFSVMLALLSKKLVVKKDERVEQILALLPGANCGACGYAGCSGLAEALVSGKAELSACRATSKSKKNEIAKILNIPSSNESDVIVVVACGGGTACKDKYEYQGYGDCRSMQLLADGRKACSVGCMGMGSCTDACSYSACEVNMSGFAEINHAKCIKCGMCVKACPKGIIKFIPAHAKVYVKCSNKDKGLAVKNICSKGCIGCGLCAKICPNSAITMKDNLPVIDYNLCSGCGLCAQKCPTEAIAKL